MSQHLRIVVAGLSAVAQALIISGVALAQDPPVRPSRTVTGLPLVPSLEPRPNQGPVAGQQWRTERRGEERQPVADFLDSLKGNDAAIEVMINQTKLLTTKQPIAREEGVAVIAVSDPSVLDFDVLPDSRMIRLIGRRVGVSDLMFITADGQSYSFAVHVVYDLELLRARLRQMFPDALIRLGQIRDHVVVEGQVRSNAQMSQVLNTIQLFLASAQVTPSGTVTGSPVQPSAAAAPPRKLPPVDGEALPGELPPENGQAPPDEDTEEQNAGVAYEQGARPTVTAAHPQPQIINLLQIPGVKQVMLKVQIAELNRTALRQIGSDLIASPGNNGLASFASSSATPSLGTDGSLTSLLFGNAAGTLVGVFDSGSFAVIMRALRQNNVATILAEPNLVTLDGHEARFQSGGQFPVPVAQLGGGAGNNRVQFKDFGVQLAFVPYILDEGVIRLHVEPEVSNIAEELGVTLIVNGQPIPGLRTRNAATTVELREGETLAIAGLLNRETDGATNRIPLLGDLPILAALFGSGRHEVIEQELLVAVTPYLVSGVAPDQRGPLPGQEVTEPKDLEFYLRTSIEGRTGDFHRSTTKWANPFRRQSQQELEQRYFLGPIGLSE